MRWERSLAAAIPRIPRTKTHCWWSRCATSSLCFRRAVELRHGNFEELRPVRHDAELGDILAKLGCGLVDERCITRVNRQLPGAADVLKLDLQGGSPLHLFRGQQGRQIVMAVSSSKHRCLFR